MFKNILKAIFTLIGGVAGWFLGLFVLEMDYLARFAITGNPILRYSVSAVIAILFAIIFFLLSPIFIKYIVRLIESIDKSFQRISIEEIIIGAIGGLIALAITYLIATRALFTISYIGPILSVLANILAFFIGAGIATKKKDEVAHWLSNVRLGRSGHPKPPGGKKPEFEGDPKVLDTSVIIDGRIYDICQTGFIEGTLIIPNFVLEELRHIADSSDSLKRNRGRRGLDILNKIQKELDIEVNIWDKEVKEAREVDIKLLKLAKELGGKVVTNDYNLNKVAEFQGVPVLNINELANAVKPVLLPGEELAILVAKVGKEQNQGIGYLDDGTMIVIENGKRWVGDTIDVIVTSVLQTAAGRMIFARPKTE